jgi:diguanylate cyclase (GGDEF)-like protein
VLLSADPLPQFDVFLRTRVPDEEMANISLGAMVLYNEFSDLATGQRATIHPVNCSRSKRSGADIVLAWQMFAPSGFLGVSFVIGDGSKVPSAHEMRIFSLLANQLAAAIESSRMHQQMVSEVAMDSAEAEDVPTGLPGKGDFMKELAHEIKRAARYGHDLSCALVDLSCLDSIKRNYSADVYDRVLGQVGRALRKNVREVDVAARFGASQFAMLLPDTNAAGARFVAQRLLLAIEDIPVAASRSKPGPCLGGEDVRVCIGQARRKNETARTLISRVQEALARAKSKGSNDTVILARACPQGPKS